MNDYTSRFQFCQTKDGSPTLQPDGGEAMHSHAGAFSETNYIYGRAIEWAFQHDPYPKFLCFGLGLGYIEIRIAVEYLKINQEKQAPIYITSLENENILTEYFCFWITQQQSKVPENFQQTYEQILSFYEDFFQISRHKILETLGLWYTSGSFRILEKLPAEKTLPQWSADCILFDAYSSKTNQDLWEEDFLDNFIQQYCSPKAVFTTYASTGNLKRALQKNRFILQPSKGFHYKKESTFATRDL